MPMALWKSWKLPSWKTSKKQPLLWQTPSTFGCGHATIPVEEMYPRIGSFVGFHPLCELPLTFFTQIIGQMGIHQFLFLERAEGYGQEIMKNYDFDSKDCMWIFSHTGINAVNIDMALEAKKRGMKVIVYGSASETGDKASRHSSGKNLFQLADIVVDSCVPLVDVTMVWMTITTVAEILADRGVHLYIHPSHNVPGDTTAHERLDAAIAEYQRKVKCL